MQPYYFIMFEVINSVKVNLLTPLPSMRGLLVRMCFRKLNHALSGEEKRPEENCMPFRSPQSSQKCSTTIQSQIYNLYI